jgi:3-isopropylmalate/(R)-2-methylmalate dehydratase large subunit
MAGQTIPEKILASHAGKPTVKPGETVVVEVDAVVLIDMNFLPGWWADILKVRDPERVIVIFDHLVPARDRQAAEGHTTGREFVARFGIRRFHDAGRDQGICHQVIADQAYAVPGEILLCIDSHTCSAGALNCAGRGMGPAEMIYSLCTGQTWFRVGETVRYDFTGEPGPWVSAKDIFLYQAGKYGDHATQNIEYGGPAMNVLGLDARRTISTMSAELSAEFAIWEPDDTLVEYITPRVKKQVTPVSPDQDAVYADRRTIDLTNLEPHVGLPDTLVHNTVPVTALKETVKLDQCFIGSCANGTLEDLRLAASVVRGRRVASSVRFIVTPGSQQVYRDALRKGYIETLSDAGALVTTSACGACAGLDMGVLGPGEVCITASTRNFKGRMGSDEASIYMGSTLTVAASAIAGEIVDPRDILKEASALSASSERD